MVQGALQQLCSRRRIKHGRRRRGTTDHRREWYSSGPMQGNEAESKNELFHCCVVTPSFLLTCFFPRYTRRAARGRGKRAGNDANKQEQRQRRLIAKRIVKAQRRLPSRSRVDDCTYNYSAFRCMCVSWLGTAATATRSITRKRRCIFICVVVVTSSSPLFLAPSATRCGSRVRRWNKLSPQGPPPSAASLRPRPCFPACPNTHE
jgi:hypothetical protein